MSVPSISDFINKDDEGKEAIKDIDRKKDLEDELILVKTYKIGDINRYVYWSGELGVFINVYGRNSNEASRYAYEIYSRISKKKLSK